MSGRSGWITTLSLDVWSDLDALGMDEWIWSDTEGAGVHRATSLPPKPPAGATHLWGWTTGRWVRLRVDSDLQGGLAGALLSESRPADSAAVETVIDLLRTEIWPASAGQVSVREIAGVTDGSQHAVIRTAYVQLEDSRGGALAPATFVQLAPGHVPAPPAAAT